MTTTTETHDMPAAALLHTPDGARGMRLFGDAGTVATIANITTNRGALVVCTTVTGPNVDGRDIREVGAAVLAAFAPAWVDHWQRGGPVVFGFLPGHLVTTDAPAPANPNGCGECDARPGEQCRESNCQGSWL